MNLAWSVADRAQQLGLRHRRAAPDLLALGLGVELIPGSAGRTGMLP